MLSDDGSWHMDRFTHRNNFHFFSILRRYLKWKGLNNGHRHQNRLEEKRQKCWLFVPFHVKIFLFLIAFLTFWESFILQHSQPLRRDWLIPEIIDYNNILEVRRGWKKVLEKIWEILFHADFDLNLSCSWCN